MISTSAFASEEKSKELQIQEGLQKITTAANSKGIYFAPITEFTDTSVVIRAIVGKANDKNYFLAADERICAMIFDGIVRTDFIKTRLAKSGQLITSVKDGTIKFVQLKKNSKAEIVDDVICNF